MLSSTKLTTRFDSDAQELVSDKIYPVYPDNLFQVLSDSDIQHITNSFVHHKLNRYYDCIQKAKLAAEYLNIKEIHLGSLMIHSTEEGVSYGYMYNPPLELHAWLQIQDKIIDFALPGTIEKGLATKDEIGYFLVGREPVILVGIPAKWMIYRTHEIVKVDDISLMNLDKAKDMLQNLINK